MNKCILKKTKPLIKKNDYVIVSKLNRVYSFNGNKLLFLFAFRYSLFNKFLDMFNCLYRLRRSGVSSSISYGGFDFFVFNKVLYSRKDNEIINEFKFINSRGPLSFASVNNVDGFDNALLFGEYVSNRNRKPVNIYRRNDIKKTWNIIYTFSEGLINHIHALIPDRQNKCIWILSGDFEHSAGIWMARNNFKSIIPIVTGDQIYRACVAFPTKDGLLYATDSQIKPNSLRILKKNNDVWISDKICDINGSSIYGCELKDFFVFSTSTEPSAITKGKIRGLIDNTPASVIKENKSDIILVNKTNLKVQVILSRKKDLLPYRLFQFGSIMFPSGLTNDNQLYIYNVGSKQNDLSTEIYNLNDGIGIE